MEKNTKSIEEQIEDIAKKQLSGIKYFTKTENINSEIDSALKISPSKSGGNGFNFPDIKLFIKTKDLRYIPVMIEVKGTKGDFIKLNSNDEIDNLTKDKLPNFKNIQKYAVNGAVHYAQAIIEHTESYKEVIAIGLNGYEKADKTITTELGVYYLSNDTLKIPKEIGKYSDLSFLQPEYITELVSKIKNINLTKEEIEAKANEYEDQIEKKLKSLNQTMQDTLKISVGSRVELVTGMIMAGLGVESKVSPLEVIDLKGEVGSKSNDGYVIINKIDSFLDERNLPKEKKDMIINDLSRVFIYSDLWKPVNGESKLKSVYSIVKNDILPIFTSSKHLDFTGKLFNILNEWVDIPDSDKNDVVLTPRAVTDLMVNLASVNKDSYVWDYAVGSAGFLISAMKKMIQDAQLREKSQDNLKSKILKIKSEQLLGIEKRSDIYMLAVLNMIIMGDGSSNIIHKDSLSEYEGNYEQGILKDKIFPANVFLLNPPYSADGKGFVFVNKALKRMKSGKAVVLIQENAGSGQGLPYTREILANNSLVASIHMADIFRGKASVQTAVYVFNVGVPHNTKSLVKFLDFSNDGYLRQNRRKSTNNVNLKDVDNAVGRYEEAVNIINYGKTYQNYFGDKEYFEDTISLNGDDWTFSQHFKFESIPSLNDFNTVVMQFMSWKLSSIILGYLTNEKLGNSIASKDELDAYKLFEDSKIIYKEFNIGTDLFDVHPTTYYKYTNPVLYKTEGQGKMPVLSNSSVNNGIGGYVALDKTENGNIITFSDTTVGADTIFYQPNDFIGYSHVQGMYPYDLDKWKENSLLYFIAVFKKVAGDKFDYSIKFTRTIVSSLTVKLPVKSDGTIDFTHMENFIGYLKKQSIQGIF